MPEEVRNFQSGLQLTLTITSIEIRKFYILRRELLTTLAETYSQFPYMASFLYYTNLDIQVQLPTRP